MTGQRRRTGRVRGKRFARNIANINRKQAQDIAFHFK